MGKLVMIVGNNGSGKTTLAKALCESADFSLYLESHFDRPYQLLFAQDVKRYALPNQIDYLLTRAEQEFAIRNSDTVGVQDGGLDQDFFLYSRLFNHKGFLDDKAFQLCERTYRALRAGLPSPDLIVRLAVPLPVLRQRLQARGRTFDMEQIVTLEDLPRLDEYLDDWLGGCEQEVVVLDVSEEDSQFSRAIQILSQKINSL